MPITIELALRTLPLCLLVLATGCSPDLSPAERASKNIAEATKNLQVGLTDLAKIDPAGIRGLLEKNETLRDQLGTLNTQLSQVGLGTGVFELRDKRLYLEIASYRGAFRINSWIDKPEGWVISDRELPEQGLSLSAFGMSREALNQATARHSDALGGNVSWTGLHEAGQRACAEVGEASLKKILEKSLCGTAGSGSIALNEQFLSPGDRSIFVQVIPTSKEMSSWSIVGRIVAVAPTGTRDIVKDFEWSSNQFPNHTSGTALPEKVARVRIATSTSTATK